MPWRDKELLLKKKRLYKLFLIGGVTFLLGQYILYTTIASYSVQLQADIAQLDEAREVLIPQQRQYRTLIKEQDLLVKKLNALPNITNNKYSVSDITRLLPSLVPQGLYLKQLRIKNNVVTLMGVSANSKLINDFIDKIKEKTEFLNLEIKSMSQPHGSHSSQNFSASFHFVSLKKSGENERLLDSDVDIRLLGDSK